MTRARTGGSDRPAGVRPLLAAGMLMLGVSPIIAVGTSAGAATAPGVTSTSIRLGMPWLDLAALQSIGLTLNQGSYPDSITALADNINAHGGINGRKIIPYFASVNPTSTASSASACTQLTQDDSVFVAIGPLYPLCYQEAGVATINGDMGASTSPNLAQNFTWTPPPSAFDPLQLSVFSKMDVFKGKKVGVVSASVDQAETPVVLAALKKLHVDVAESAVDSAPQGDTTASNQDVQIIAQKFENAGVSVVVGVGTGASAFLTGLNDDQSTYTPRLVATNYSDFAGTVSAKGGDNPTYLKGALTATTVPSQQVIWNDPAIQKCVHIIEKAYPSVAIGNPIDAPANAPTTWVAPENSCEYMALFDDIVKAAGKNLTEKSFQNAAYSLHDVSIPGIGTMSFDGRPYALGPVYLVTYDAATQKEVIANKSSAG